jgi:hypothetical protein
MMDKITLVEILKNKTRPGEEVLREGLINRLEAALRAPLSFDELTEDLPPAARYLGPGVWMETIKKAPRALFPGSGKKPAPGV